MTEKSSLLGYIDEGLVKLTREVTIGKSGSDLEKAVVSSYEAVQEDLKGSHKTDIFDIYLDAKDIDKDQVRRYLDGLKSLQKAPYKKKESSWLNKRLYKTSDWYEKSPHFNGITGSFADKHGIKVATSLASAMTVLGFEITGIITGEPMFYVLGCASGGLPPLASYLLFWKKTDLKPTTHHFKKDQAKNYILELRRFHLLTQEMEKEVDDIHRLDNQHKYKFIRKYGLIRMKREKAKTDYLTKDELEKRILEYGAIEVSERVNKAKDEVRNVRNSIEIILKGAGAEPIELSQSYKPAGLRWYEENVAPINYVENELNASDPHERAEELRRKQAAGLANKNLG